MRLLGLRAEGGGGGRADRSAISRASRPRTFFSSNSALRPMNFMSFSNNARSSLSVHGRIAPTSYSRDARWKNWQAHLLGEQIAREA